MLIGIPSCWSWISSSKPHRNHHIQRSMVDDFNGQVWVVNSPLLSSQSDDRPTEFSLSPLPDHVARVRNELFLARDTTWNWCCKFVTTFGLCPWAKGSVETPNAVQLFIVPSLGADDDDGIREDLLQYFGRSFTNEESDLDQATSIYFVIFLEDAKMQDFSQFYDWFVQYEEYEWDLQEKVTLAPFHPDWTYSPGDGEGSTALDIEKQSPYPTVTLVATEAIDRAGEEVTRRIAETNEVILASKTRAEWHEIYNAVVYDK